MAEEVSRFMGRALSDRELYPEYVVDHCMSLEHSVNADSERNKWQILMERVSELVHKQDLTMTDLRDKHAALQGQVEKIAMALHDQHEVSHGSTKTLHRSVLSRHAASRRQLRRPNPVPPCTTTSASPAPSMMPGARNQVPTPAEAQAPTLRSNIPSYVRPARIAPRLPSSSTAHQKHDQQQSCQTVIGR